MRKLLIVCAGLLLALAPGWGTALAADGELDVTVTIPEPPSTAGPRNVDDAALSWGINPESGSGSFFGGCNFLSAGIAGDAGGSRLWTAADGLFRSQEGAVTIEKPVSASTWRRTTFDDKCLDERTGTPRQVTATGSDFGTGNRFVITGGSGRIDPSTNSATLTWKGSVTVVFYGGLTYFSLSDPTLTVTNGKGTLTATASGYGTSMEDMSKWVPLASRTVTVATLDGVSFAGERGLTTTPAYRGITVTPAAGAAEQDRTGKDWGAFPQSYVDFVSDAGQGGYWYSTGGQRDFAKPPTPLSVSWSAADRVDGAAPVNPPRGGGSSSAPGTTTPRRTAQSPKATSPVAAPPSALPPSTGGDFPATTPNVLSSTRGLIPTANAVVEDPRALLVISSSALVALSAIAGVGFRRRWLVLPWSRGDAGE
ncbi:MAG TPA: HtaA domain-containing protein [Arachnia sp.]|mgnify:CR=1 FL=1|nr:HtaA domain-containing protein [Arachnia sp.]HMT86107.1 HtaA domain-containing protein [Arachnia sp.]